MTCDELREEYDAFALGISEGAELAALREHLAANCPTCAPAVREALDFAASLSLGVRQTDPAPGLRRRILAMVQARPSGPRVVWLACLGAVLALLAFFTVRLGMQQARSSEALALLSSGDVKQLSVQQPEFRADIFASRSRGVLFLASNFKPAPAGKIYEMWIIAKGAQPAPAGLFAPRADGSVLHIARPIDQPLAAVAVTVEPEHGSDHPTTKPFLVATP